jgi:hypothetical protein
METCLLGRPIANGGFSNGNMNICRAIEVLYALSYVSVCFICYDTWPEPQEPGVRSPIGKYVISILTVCVSVCPP